MPYPALDIETITSCLLAIGQHQDQDAFSTLFEILSGPLMAYAQRMHFSAEQAEDITQDIMLRLWKNAKQFDPSQGHTLGWIYRIARNTCIDRLRKTHAPYPMPDQAETLITHHSSTDKHIDQKRQFAHMQKALDTLPPEQAALIRLAYFQSMTHKEMATHLNLPLGTVKSRLRLALAHLRKHMQPKDKTGDMT